MGWWWSSSADAGEPPSQRPDQSDSHREQPQPQQPTPDAPNGEDKDVPRALNRNEQALADLKELFSQIDPERSERASTAAREIATRKVEHDPDSIYSSEMSCTQCFDLAYYCSSVGGQLNNVYRYGGLRSCSDQWAQWRFCMRNKALSEDTRRERVREWNQKRAAKYRMGRSSEDVWEVRTEPVDAPFSEDLDQYKY